MGYFHAAYHMASEVPENLQNFYPVIMQGHGFAVANIPLKGI